MVASNPFVPAGCVDAAAKQINPSCIDPVAQRLLSLVPDCRTCPAPASSATTSSPTASSTTTSISSTSASTTRCAPAGDQMFGRYSFQNTDRHEPPVLDDPIASGDFASDIFNRGQNAVGGWSRGLRRVGVQRVPLRLEQGPLRLDSSGVRRRCQRQFGIRGVPNDPRFYGGLPHMPIARFARLGGPFFRPQFQWSQVFQFANNLTVEPRRPRDEVRHRAPPRPGDLHRRPARSTAS